MNTMNQKVADQAQLPAAPSARRAPRILWANVYCLLDTSSGASMAVREMLRQLALRGYEIAICGAMIFDHERGRQRIVHDWGYIQQRVGEVVSVRDDPLIHYLLSTRSTRRDEMSSGEENRWMAFYTATLDKLRPDLVFYYGGQALDMLIADEARHRGIPVVAYLANPNYGGRRWCRDVDLILTDSEATAQLYRDQHGYAPIPIGSFIDPSPVVAPRHERRRLLLINPSIEKGAAIVALLALILEARRPDIEFEVVESRGSWQSIVDFVKNLPGMPKGELRNVTLTSNTDDMRPIFGRARLLLALSLWWESAGRVVAEAMLNGIPALVSNRGGLPEVIGEGGFKIDLPAECFEPPYQRVPTPEALEPMIALIERFYDDEDFYQQYVANAVRAGQERHSLDANTTRLEQALGPLLALRAADSALRASAASQPPAAPKVSVVFPVGNRLEFLAEAIESILAQTLVDFEFLIIADGVTPAVLSILHRYTDPRIRLIRLPVNVGFSGARNVGLAAARAPFVALMDSDDVAMPQRLEVQHAFLQAHPEVTVCSSNSVKFFPDGTEIHMRYPQSDAQIKARLLIVDSAILNPTAMYRMDFVRQHHVRYDPNLLFDDDHRFYVDLMRAGAKFNGLPDELLRYRRHATNFTNDLSQADRVKSRIREILMPMYFPKLRGDDHAAIVRAMCSVFQGGVSDVQRSIDAIDHALKEGGSFYGEDRDELRNILKNVRSHLELLAVSPLPA